MHIAKQLSAIRLKRRIGKIRKVGAGELVILTGLFYILLIHVEGCDIEIDGIFDGLVL